MQRESILKIYLKKLKHHRLDNVRYSKDVFIEFCKKSFECEINSDEIYFKSSKSKISDYDGYQGNIISPNEQKLLIYSKLWSDIKLVGFKSLANEFDVSDHH